LTIVREAHGLSRAQAADAADWSVDRIAAIEEGSAEVEWSAVLSLLEAMGADSAELSVAYARVLAEEVAQAAGEGAAP
jgi:transcriptional regulator with XRE-family HTH domain